MQDLIYEEKHKKLMEEMKLEDEYYKKRKEYDYNGRLLFEGEYKLK